MKSANQHNFARVPSVEIPRSVFDRSHGYKTTFNENGLIPFYVDEALPGDTFKAKTTIFCRLATPMVPFMDNLYLDTFYFAVPCRLLWSHWVNFMGEKLTVNDTTDYVVPEVDIGTQIATGGLYDYMGLPVGVTFNKDNQHISALPFRAYNMIYNQWFRDQNTTNPITCPTGDGPDNYGYYTIQKRTKRHDYFTSALPWPQKGPGVTIPLGTTAPVKGNGFALGLSDGTNGGGLLSTVGNTYLAGAQQAYGQTIGTSIGSATQLTGGVAIGVLAGAGQSGLIADLTNATAATINSVRQAFQLQRLYERDARGGTRYPEMILAHFGVKSPDERQQRAEYLGGSSQRISVNPVQQTSGTPPDGTDNATPQGNLAAFGLVTDQSGGFTKSFTEHCIIIGLVNVRADLTYSQGIPRMFSRRTRVDHYFPALAHLGEQEILKKEIYFQNNNTYDNAVFGYQERYAEYRYFPSQITGLYRPAATTPLDMWHLSEKFESLPSLNQTFLELNTPINRVVAVPSQPHFLFDSYIELHCARPMPVYSVPGLIDHF